APARAESARLSIRCAVRSVGSDQIMRTGISSASSAGGRYPRPPFQTALAAAESEGLGTFAPSGPNHLGADVRAQSVRRRSRCRPGGADGDGQPRGVRSVVPAIPWVGVSLLGADVRFAGPGGG